MNGVSLGCVRVVPLSKLSMALRLHLSNLREILEKVM